MFSSGGNMWLFYVTVCLAEMELKWGANAHRSAGFNERWELNHITPSGDDLQPENQLPLRGSRTISTPKCSFLFNWFFFFFNDPNIVSNAIYIWLWLLFSASPPEGFTWMEYCLVWYIKPLDHLQSLYERMLRLRTNLATKIEPYIFFLYLS